MPGHSGLLPRHNLVVADRLTLKIVNEELRRRGHQARLEKGSGYFYFFGGEAAEWLDRTIDARTINTFTLKEWIEEFLRLKALNAQIMKTASGGTKAPRPSDQRGTKPSGSKKSH